MADPWDAIQPSHGPGTIHVRRADPKHPLDLFRGKDHEGNLLFSFKVHQATSETKELPELALLDISITPHSDGSSEFTIRLLDKSHADIFRALCADLMVSTEGLSQKDDGAGIDIMLARLRRWKALFRLRHEKRLSEAEIIGLFGELLLLRDTFLTHLQPYEAVATWRGPHMDEQDFLLGDWLVEVKTQVSSSDSKLQISSEHQLDSKSGQILICHQTLGIAGRDTPAARSLATLVAEVTDLLSTDDAGACDRFLAILLEHGYMELPEYDKATWVLNERSFFAVESEFPRIISADLRDGVQGVQYSIRLESCESFRLSESDGTKRIFSRHE